MQVSIMPEVNYNLFSYLKNLLQLTLTIGIQFFVKFCNYRTPLQLRTSGGIIFRESIDFTIILNILHRLKHFTWIENF